MAEIKIDSFLILERSLAKRLSRSWKKTADPLNVKILRALKKEDQTQVDLLIGSVDFGKILRSNRKFMKFIARAAFLFGVGRVQDIRKSEFLTDDKSIPLFKEATANLVKGIETQGNKFIKNTLNKTVQQIRDRDNQGKVTKAEIVRSNAELLANATGKRTDNYLETVSSLHNSRLAAWGYVQEAQALNITTYAVSEQVDSAAICPICLTMHGKTFTVSEVEPHLESLLTLDNLDDARSISPWPKQDKASVARLGGLSNEDIVKNGWHTPPYHPRCRGLLVRVDDKQNLGDLSAANKKRVPKPLRPGTVPVEPVGPSSDLVDDILRPPGIQIISPRPLPIVDDLPTFNGDGIPQFGEKQKQEVVNLLSTKFSGLLGSGKNVEAALAKNPQILEQVSRSMADVGIDPKILGSEFLKEMKLNPSKKGSFFNAGADSIELNTLDNKDLIHHQFGHLFTNRFLMSKADGGKQTKQLMTSKWKNVKDEFQTVVTPQIASAEKIIGGPVDLTNPVHLDVMDINGLLSGVPSAYAMAGIVEYSAESAKLFLNNPVSRQFLKTHSPAIYDALISILRGDGL